MKPSVCARCGHVRRSHANDKNPKWTGCLTYKCLPHSASADDDKCPAFVPSKEGASE